MVNTKKGKVLCTGDYLSADDRAALAELDLEVQIEDADIGEDDLVEALHGVDALILGGSACTTTRVIESAKTLKLIAFFGTGYENYVDVATATKRNIAVTYTPGANAPSVAEFTMTLILDSLKKTPYLSRTTKMGEWKTAPIRNLAGATLGIVGLGAIGSRVAQMAHNGFGAKICYSSRSPKPELANPVEADFMPLEELLKVSDIVSLHVNLRPETTNMIGPGQLKLMKADAILVNTSRAGLVDPKALHEALVEGSIASAAFDGYYREPVPSPQEDPYKLLALPDRRFIVTPHNAFYTEDATRRTLKMCIESIRRFFNGETPTNLLNPDYAKQTIKGA